MYRKPAFLKTIIPATTAGNIFYPPASGDGSPVLPIVLHPKMQDGSASPGPERISIRAYAPGTETFDDELLCGYVCSANADGSVSRRFGIWYCQLSTIESPDAVVIEKIETPFPVEFELLGFSDQTNPQS